ncbi:MAG: DUF3108 domain-containing protein [Muribaculaceae bacterium]|nr:DUF3108 domain-containing protein [Muribaculaceae bacterium]
MTSLHSIKIAILLLVSLATSVAGLASGTVKLAPETLNYKVMFKWGIINKQAGTATLRLTHNADTYFATLAAKSAPWADKIYKVRDTLNGRMTYRDLTPLFYEKIANEGGERKHDVVTYDYSTQGLVRADCIRKVYKKGVLKVDETRTLRTEGDAVDMLTSFYFMRTLPFTSMTPGTVTRIDIFSGKRKELLSITYHGVVDADLDGSTAKAYHISFTFTSGNGKKTSDDMEAWISTGPERIPLRLEGKLPVGKVHCIYTGKDAR